MPSKTLPTFGRVAALAVALLLPACVSLAPDTGPTKTAHDVFDKLDDRSQAYKDAQATATEGLGWYNAGIVAATMAAAAAVAFSHGAAATNIIAGAGIGAAALTLGYQPGSRASQYKALSTARSQLLCLKRNMAHYRLVGNENELRDQLAKEVATLQKSINDAAILVGKKPPVSDATPKNLAALAKAIAAGSSASEKAQVELNAFKQIDATVTSTYETIDLTVTDALAPSYLTYTAQKGTTGTAGGANQPTNIPQKEHPEAHVQGAIPPLPEPPPLTKIEDAIQAIQTATMTITTDDIVSSQNFSNAISMIPTCVSPTAK